MTRASFPILVLILMLSACVGQRYDIVKTGVSEEQERQDWGLCGGNFDANGNPEINTEERDVVFNCMKQKGYGVRKH